MDKRNKISFEEYLDIYYGFDSDDIEHLLSSDELEELKEDYEDWLVNG